MAQDSERATLEGVDEVVVVVETLTAESEEDGLNREQITTDVELRLRKSQIRVLDTDSLGVPYLYVNINAVKGTEHYGYSIDVDLKQAVVLKRRIKDCLWPELESLTHDAGELGIDAEFMDAYLDDTTFKYSLDSTLSSILISRLPYAIRHCDDLWAATWHVSATGICHESRLRAVVREAVADLVDKFINDYLAARN